MNMHNLKLINLEDIPELLNLDNDEKKFIYFIYFSNKDLKKEITLNLNSEKCQVFLKGAIYLYGDSKCSLKVNVTHNKGNNKARVHIKTVLDSNSKFNFEGMIKIAEHSHLSDSYLKQENLIVSEDAVCNTSPQLEIKADQVKASHGATIGGFNSDHLFYLKSRGIEEKQAKIILEEAFLISVFKGKISKLPFNL